MSWRARERTSPRCVAVVPGRSTYSRHFTGKYGDHRCRSSRLAVSWPIRVHESREGSCHAAPSVQGDEAICRRLDETSMRVGTISALTVQGVGSSSNNQRMAMGLQRLRLPKVVWVAGAGRGWSWWLCRNEVFLVLFWRLDSSDDSSLLQRRVPGSSNSTMPLSRPPDLPLCALRSSRPGWMTMYATAMAAMSRASKR